jgi:hypothetical protein
MSRKNTYPVKVKYFLTDTICFKSTSCFKVGRYGGGDRRDFSIIISNFKYIY